MLDKEDDPFVRREKRQIKLFMLNNDSEESVAHAREVSKYIRNNFDNVVGENVVMDIEEILEGP